MAMESRAGPQIVVRDFNLHRPPWGGERVGVQHKKARDVIRIINRYDIVFALPSGAVTFPATGRHEDTTIDLVLYSTELADKLVKCIVIEDHSHDSDRLSVSTKFELRPLLRLKKHDEIASISHLPNNMPDPDAVLNSPQRNRRVCKGSVRSVGQAVAASTPYI